MGLEDFTTHQNTGLVQQQNQSWSPSEAHEARLLSYQRICTDTYTYTYMYDYVCIKVGMHIFFIYMIHIPAKH